MEINGLFLNCTLKKSPEESNTEGLINMVRSHFDELDVKSEVLRPVDYNIPFGVVSDMGGDDEWPQLLDKIKAADILVMAMSIWFGVRSSVAQLVIERLDGVYEETNDAGQYPMYNKVGGVVVTGNEDGAHACAETTLFNLTHLGFAIPPNADTYWVGDAGPGPSFLEANGQDHPYTQKTSTWMAHNVVHLARILKENPIPPDGNTVQGWEHVPHPG
jgi:multimeric flavodoxin WrbA